MCYIGRKREEIYGSKGFPENSQWQTSHILRITFFAFVVPVEL